MFLFFIAGKPYLLQLIYIYISSHQSSMKTAALYHFISTLGSTDQPKICSVNPWIAQSPIHPFPCCYLYLKTSRIRFPKPSIAVEFQDAPRYTAIPSNDIDKVKTPIKIQRSVFLSLIILSDTSIGTNQSQNSDTFYLSLPKSPSCCGVY